MGVRGRLSIVLLVTAIIALALAQGAGTKVLPLVVQRYYEPGETMEVKLAYFDDSGLVTGESTIIQLTDPRGQVMDKRTITPSGPTASYTYEIPMGTPPNYEDPWFGSWTMTALMGDYMKAVSFDVRRQVGRRYNRGLYEKEAYISQHPYANDAAIIISPRSSVLPSGIDTPLPVTAVHRFGAYRGVMIVRVYTDTEKVFEEFTWVEEGTYVPSVNLSPGSYHVVADIFPGEGRRTQATSLTVAPAIVLVPTPDRCNVFVVVLLDPATMKPVQGASVTVNGVTLTTNTAGHVLFPKGSVSSDQTTIIYTLPDGRNGSYKLGTYSSCSSSSWTDIAFATDRPIYNPGQTVFFRGYSWKWTGERVLPVSQKIKVTLRSNRGFTILEETLTSNEYGIYDGQVTLPMNIDEETYWFNVDGGRGQQIEVKFFEKKQLISEMELDKENEGYDHGDVVKGNVSLRYYFGKPASNSDVELTVWWAAREPGSGYYGGRVYYDEPMYYGGEMDYYEPMMAKEMAYPGMVSPRGGGPDLVKLQVYKRINLTTDTDGVGSFEVPLEELKGTHIVVEAHITDPAGRTVDLSKSAKLAPEVTVSVAMTYYPGNETLHLTATSKGTDASNLRSMTMDLTGVPPDGKPEEITDLTLDPTTGSKVEQDFTVSRDVALKYMYLEGELGVVDRYGRAWGAFGQAVSGKYELTLTPRLEGEKVVAELTLTDALTGEPVKDDDMRWSFNGPMAGQSVGIHIQTSSDGTETIGVPVPHHPEGLYAISATATIGFNEETGYDRGLTLTVQRPVVLGTIRTARLWTLTQEVEPGDEARFVHQFEGFAPDAVIIERHYMRNIPLRTVVRNVGDGGNFTVSIPTTEDDLGGVGLAVFAVGTNGITYPLGGQARLKLKGLRTTISVDREVYEPRDELTLTVTVTDKEGRPVPNAAVGVKVVDQSVIDASERGDVVSRPLSRSWSITSNANFQSNMNMRRMYGTPVNDPTKLESSSANPARVNWDRGDYMQRNKGRALAGGSMALPGAPRAAPAMEMEAGFASADMADEGMMMAKESKAMSLSAGETADVLATVQMRTMFPETFLWEPFALTGEDGTFTTTVMVPDSLTTWKAAVYASTMDARYAENATDFVSQKEFFIKPYFPASLTQGDNTTMQMTVHSYLDGDLDALAGLKEEEWFDLFTPNAATFTLHKDIPQSVSWRLRARTPFYQNLTFFATASTSDGTELTDGVQNRIWVRPNGVPWEETVSGDTDKKEVTFTINVPKEAYDISVRGYARFGSESLSIYTGSARVDGYSYPTTEVTASKIIPTVLSHEYRAKLKLITSDRWFKERVRGLALELVFMRHADGGWGWWKKGPSTTYMTAYALRALSTAKRHVLVDDSMVYGAVNWLTNHANGDGSYNGTQWLTGNDAGMTAYVLISLAEAGQSVPGEGMNFLHQKWIAGEITDPYTIALYARLLSHTRDAQGDERAVVNKLLSLLKEDDPYIFWSRGYSLGGPDETTAQAAMALLEQPAYRDTAKAALKWLRERNPWEFTTTADQIASLAAHLRLLEIEPPVIPDMNVELYVNGERIDSVHLEGIWGMSGELRLTDYLRHGENTIRIVRRGKGKLFYDVWSTATLGGNVTAAFEVGEPASPGVYPVKMTLTPHADVAVPARISIELPVPDGVEVRPTRRLYVDSLPEPRTFELYYVTDRAVDRLELGTAKAEYGLARGTKVGGKQFESWELPVLTDTQPAGTGPALTVSKSASFATAGRDRVHVTLVVHNTGNDPVTGDLYDFVPAGLTAAGSEDKDPDLALHWPVDLAARGSTSVTYELYGEPGKYKLDAAVAFTDDGMVSSEPVGVVLVRGEDIVVLRTYDTTVPDPGDNVNVSITVTSGVHQHFVVVEEPIPPGFTVTGYADEGGSVRKVIVKADKIVWFLDHTSDVGLWYELAATSEGRVQAAGTRAYPQFTPENEGFADEVVLSIGQDAPEPEPVHVVELPYAEGVVVEDPQPTARPVTTPGPTTDATPKPTAAATPRPTVDIPENPAAREAYYRNAMATIDSEAASIEDSEVRSRISDLSRMLDAAVKAGDHDKAKSLIQEINGMLDEASGVPPGPDGIPQLKTLLAVAFVIAALFAMSMFRSGKGGGGAGLNAMILVCLVAGLVLAAVLPDAPATAMTHVDITERELFVRPSLSINVGAPEDETVALTYTMDLSMVNRQETPVEAMSFVIDQSGLTLIPQNREAYTESTYSAPNGGSIITVSFKTPVFIGEERSVYVELKGETQLTDLETTIKTGFSTPEFFRSYNVQLTLANGMSLNRTSFATASTRENEWNPDWAQWSETCAYGEGEETLNDDQCFSDMVGITATLRARPVTITDVAIKDILKRDLKRTRTWTITYQNIGRKSVERLPFDLGSRTTIATSGVSFDNGEAVLATPLGYKDTITIEAREKTASLGYGQATLETTPDELKRAIAPARRYRAHVEVHGLTVEWQNGLWNADREEESGVITFDMTATSPITYSLRVVT